MDQIDMFENEGDDTNDGYDGHRHNGIGVYDGNGGNDGNYVYEANNYGNEEYASEFNEQDYAPGEPENPEAHNFGADLDSK